MALKHAASLGISSNDLMDHLLQLKFWPGVVLHHLTPNPVVLGVPLDQRPAPICLQSKYKKTTDTDSWGTVISLRQY